MKEGQAAVADGASYSRPCPLETASSRLPHLDHCIWVLCLLKEEVEEKAWDLLNVEAKAVVASLGYLIIMESFLLHL